MYASRFIKQTTAIVEQPATTEEEEETTPELKPEEDFDINPLPRTRTFTDVFDVPSLDFEEDEFDIEKPEKDGKVVIIQRCK